MAGANANKLHLQTGGLGKSSRWTSMDAGGLNLSQLREFVQVYARERAEGAEVAAAGDSAALKQKRFFSAQKETERFFMELLDSMLTLAQDGFFNSSEEIWSLCSPLIHLLDSRVKARQSGESGQTAKHRKRSTDRTTPTELASPTWSTSGPSVNIRVSNPMHPGMPTEPFESDEPTSPAAAVVIATSESSQGTRVSLAPKRRRASLIQMTYGLTNVAAHGLTSMVGTLRPRSSSDQTAPPDTRGKLQRNQHSREAIAILAGSMDAATEQAEAEEEQEAGTLTRMLQLQKERYRVSAMNNTEVRSKERILHILGVVSQMSLDLRLSQLLHLHSQEIIGGGKSRTRSSLTKLKSHGLLSNCANSRQRWQHWLVNERGSGFLDSGTVLFIIMLLVFASIVQTAFPPGEDLKSEEEVFEWTGLSVFVLEMSLRMFAMGIWKYLRDSMCFVDLLVVGIDVLFLALEYSFDAYRPSVSVSDLGVQPNRTSTSASDLSVLEHASVLKGLRLLRFARLLRLRRVFKAAADRLKKQEKGECLTEMDVKHFEDLFKKEEREATSNKNNFGAALELNLMSKREPLIAICGDLLMYQSDSLFEAAFFMLVSNFCQRKALVEAVSAVQLVPRLQEKSLASMEEDLHLLRESISSFAIWARGGGKGDLEQGERVLDTLEKLTEVCSAHRVGRQRVDDDELGIVWERAPGWRKYGTTPDGTRPPNASNQALLMKLGVHDVVLQAIQLRPATGADSAGGESRVDDEVKLIVAQIQAACADFMREFARR
jgi:hypothetical protein